jgi:hypothetical protein
MQCQSTPMVEIQELRVFSWHEWRKGGHSSILYNGEKINLPH